MTNDFTNIAIHKETHQQLKVAAALLRISMAELIRQMLEKHQAEKP